MHDLSTSFVLGYHGCDTLVAGSLLAGKNFKSSKNDYDWLGHGIYFWEANPLRGLDFARELRNAGKMQITEPAVVGAVVALGYCLDLTTATGIEQVKVAYQNLSEAAVAAGFELPRNGGGEDLLVRRLDCAVLNALHELRDKAGERSFDTVKGIFIEGDRIYDGAGLFEKTHTQICVRNPDMIKGVFRVPERFLKQ